MITAEIKVNGAMLQHLYIHNQGIADADTSLVTCLYEYEYYRVGTKDPIVKGCILHDRTNGAGALIMLALENAITLLNQQKNANDKTA